MTQSCHIIGLIVLLLIAGCSQPIVINPDWACNITYNNTKILYINRTVNETIYLHNNTECLCDPCIQQPCKTGGYSRTYVNSLKRDIRVLQKNQDNFWNYSDCQWDLNNTKKKYNQAVFELCETWNASWC